MKVLLIEDETLAAERVQDILVSIDSTITVVGHLKSVESSIQWLQSNPAPDLILMDIELADGQSFEIFERVNVTSPVIFTTSYDEYAVKAFKVNSVDYLLKPIQKDELQSAIDKYRNLKKQ